MRFARQLFIFIPPSHSLVSDYNSCISLLGKAGPEGATGPQGDKGDKGEPGAAGRKGEKGDGTVTVRVSGRVLIVSQGYC